MVAHSTAVKPPLDIVTVEEVPPSPPVQPAIVLRSHQKVTPLCFAAVGLVATAGWLYLIVMAFRALAVILVR
jgi:hypothetical protein